MFWALLRDHFDPRLPARPKISLGGAQDLFKPTNTNSIVSSGKKVQINELLIMGELISPLAIKLSSKVPFLLFNSSGVHV